MVSPSPRTLSPFRSSSSSPPPSHPPSPPSSHSQHILTRLSPSSSSSAIVSPMPLLAASSGSTGNSPSFCRSSPVVPSSSSSVTSRPVSRPGSPRIAGDAAASLEEGIDQTHVFERDVEFNHRLIPREAVDISVAPVLDQAFSVLSATTGTDMLDDFTTIVPMYNRNGWESPSLTLVNSTNVHASGFGTSSGRTTRSNSRSRGMDTIGVGIERDGVGPRSRSTSPSVISPSPSLSTSLLSGGLHLSPGTSPIVDRIKGERADEMMSISPSLENLSFTSYADLVNEERFGELTGAARGEEC